MVSVTSPYRTLLQTVPFTLIPAFAAGLTMAPSLFVFRYLVCLAWYTSTDPTHLPDSPSDARCTSRDVEAQYTSMVAAFTAIGGITTLVATSAVQRLADKIGRKKMLVGLPVLEAISCGVLLFAFTLNNPTVIYGLMIGNSILSATAVLVMFIPMLVIADVAAVEDRTPWYSRTTGATMFGTGTALLATGLATRLTGSLWGPFYIDIALQLSLAAYALLFMPETRVQPKVAEAESAEVDAATVVKRRAIEGLLLPLKPLGLLFPGKDATTRKRSWTLFLLSSSVFVSTFADSFPTICLILYMQDHYHFLPGEIGYVFAWMLGTKFLYLVFVFPVILKFGRRAFHRYQLRHPIHQSVNEAPALVDETTPLLEPEVLAEGEVAGEGEVLVVEKPGALANHFDVIMAYFSILLNVLGCILVAVSTRWEQVVGAFAVLSTSGGFRPSINSTFLACVSPAQASEVLAALEILTAIAATVSSLVLGSVYSILVKHDRASLLYAIAAALQFTASLFLLPIKRI